MAETETKLNLSDIDQHSPGQKRKRLSGSASPDTRRPKRAAALAVVGAVEPVEPVNNFLKSAIDLGNGQDHVDVDDFTALAQAAGEDETAGAVDNESTAAAALSIFPNLRHTSRATADDVAPTAQAGGSETQTEQSSELSFNDAAVTGRGENAPLENGEALPPSAATASTHSIPTGVPATTNGVQALETLYRSTPAKPPVGSDEWNELRKNNHKEVERRRRETINEGINELAKIVPGCEKNKGQILASAVSFIQQLKDQESQSLEKWTLEKLLTEQAITELTSSNDKLKQECDRLFRESEMWKKMAQSGVQPKKEAAEAN